jgi:hypothetical protein
VYERQWASVLRVPLADGVAWFKVCAPVQAFEPRLTAELHRRWPDRISEVLAFDADRGWLLLADAGTPIQELGNPPERWMQILPLYAQLQRREVAHADDHLAHGVTDLRVTTLVERYDDLLRHQLPLAREEIAQLRDHAPLFAESCDELTAVGIPDTIQHDDLHMGNVYVRGEQLRILDWGDASVSHPFASLVVTFRFLEEVNGLRACDPWFARLRDAYLEPWNIEFRHTFALALRVGAFAHTFGWLRQREYLPVSERPLYDKGFAIVLRRALSLAADEFPPPARS